VRCPVRAFVSFRTPCWTHKSPAPEGFLARGTISELMAISITERTHCEHPTRSAFSREDFPHGRKIRCRR
jgi:hypothetical protein